jgi:hypothetical protein
MKKRITTLLIAAMLLNALQIQAAKKKVEVDPRQPKITILELMIFIGISACVLSSVSYVIVKVHKNTITPQDIPVTLVLEKSFDHVTWVPVITNTVTLHGTNEVEFFREHQTDTIAFYRTRRML